MLLGYCTNVHAGADWRSTQANLRRYALDVKQQFSPERPMGVGLWFSRQAAAELLQGDHLLRFRDWLAEQRLLPYTLNGFPYGDFHQQVVKHRVYEPQWWTAERQAYTWDLVRILDALLPAGDYGSISTLPIAWGRPLPSEDSLRLAAERLLSLADQLAELKAATGRRIMLCLEPEPGCVLDDRHDVVQWFERLHSLARSASQHDAITHHLGVCHDVCHSVVMFEPQQAAWDAYQAAKIHVGKVQVSSAVIADFAGCKDEPLAGRKLDQLRAFNEPRYLHQTCVRDAAGDVRFYEDLSQALEHEQASGEWRVHFHVPIFLEQFDDLAASPTHIHDCLQAAQAARAGWPDIHIEVETYAWNVLPEPLRGQSLAEGVARELTWLSQRTT